MVWSYSRLSQFDTCPYAWYKTYIDDERGEENFFSQYGQFVHKCIELFFKGKINYFELLNYYEENFKKEVTTRPVMYNPSIIYESYYQDGYNYFENFVESEKKVLGVEKEINFTYNGEEFTGFIDLLLMDKNYNLEIIDHKSFKPKFLKNGELDKKSKQTVESYKKQLYLYSTEVFQEYGKYPKTMGWNFFRLGEDTVHTIPFDLGEYQKTMSWVMETVDKIKNEKMFLPNSENGFFCTSLCQFKDSCEYV